MDGEPVVYRIDAQDRITGVNAAWDRFAAANGADFLADGRVLSRPLWDFVSDSTTRHLYRQILEKVRAGRAVSFPFRCDSPGARRFLEMRARAAGDGAVEFEVRTLALEERPAQPLLAPRADAAGGPLVMCGWCKRLPVSGRWTEIEEAAAALSLFETAVPPLLTHGMCPDCERRVNAELDAASA